MDSDNTVAVGNGSYRIMPRKKIVSGDLEISALQPCDINSVRIWRNAQMDVLRQTERITQQQQERYFASEVWPDKKSQRPTQVLLAIRRFGELIGYGGLVHIRWEPLSAEISFLLAPELEASNGMRELIFASFLDAIKRLAFNDLLLNRLFTETYSHRGGHIATLEAAGMQVEGCLRENVLINGELKDSILHSIIRRDLCSKA